MTTRGTHHRTGRPRRLHRIVLLIAETQLVFSIVAGRFRVLGAV